MSTYVDIGDFSPSMMPLDDLLETYTHCLDLSRQYVKKTYYSDEVSGEVDIDALSQFLSARADLFTVAEISLDALAEANRAGQGDNLPRRELINKIVAILQEMTVIEEQLAKYLSDHMKKMRETINHMKKAEPVFKRYSHLGGDQLEPSRINRHE